MPRIVTAEEHNIRKIRGAAIRLYRTSMNYKLNEMAGKLCLCPTLYGRMEAGKGPIDESAYEQIKQMFNEWRINKIKMLQDDINRLMLIE